MLSTRRGGGLGRGLGLELGLGGMGDYWPEFGKKLAGGGGGELQLPTVKKKGRRGDQGRGEERGKEGKGRDGRVGEEGKPNGGAGCGAARKIGGSEVSRGSGRRR